MLDDDAVARELVREIGDLGRRFRRRRRIDQLRTDVAIDANDLQARQVGGATVECRRGLDRDAELGGLEPGGNVRMGFRIDVRIDAQRNRRPHAMGAGDLVQLFQLGGRFDVEAADADLQPVRHFQAALADARKQYLAGVAARSQYARQFAAGNDVEPGAQRGEQFKDGEVGIGLDRIADQGAIGDAVRGQRLAIVLERCHQRGTRIDVAGRTVSFGNLVERYAFGMQAAVVAGKRAHRPASLALLL